MSQILCRQSVVLQCCVAEYGFCIEFVTCVQCALKSHVRPQCGDGIEFKN